ncbi:MAG: phospholipid carrier-dependent glycosyltransferase, partial [Candidatus Omnitrophota bacterium]
MKEKIETKPWVLLIIFLAIGTNFAGIRWGLPSVQTNQLYFSSKEAAAKRGEEIKKYPLETASKGMGAYLAQHPEEARRKLPRSWYNPIRSYHPDEYYVIKSISTMDPANLDFNPHQYGVGGAYLYLVALLIFLLAKLNLILLSSDIGFYFLHPEEMAKFYLVGRTVTALYGIGIVWFVYLTAKKLWKNERAGLFAGLLTAISPLILINTHYMYVDIPGLFWVTVALYYAVSLSTEQKKPGNKSYFLLGLFTGLAAGNKIPFVVSFVIPVLSAFLKRERAWNKIITSFAGFLFAFFVTNPYFLLAFPESLVELRQHTGIAFSGLSYLKYL